MTETLGDIATIGGFIAAVITLWLLIRWENKKAQRKMVEKTASDLRQFFELERRVSILEKSDQAQDDRIFKEVRQLREVEMKDVKKMIDELFKKYNEHIQYHMEMDK